MTLPFTMPEFDDDGSKDSLGRDLFQNLYGDFTNNRNTDALHREHSFNSLPTNLVDKLDEKDLLMTQDLSAAFEHAINDVLDASDEIANSWGKVLVEIRRFAFESNHSTIVDASKGVLKDFDLQQIQWVYPLIHEQNGGIEGIPQFTPTGISSKFIVEVIIVFGAKSKDNVRWLIINFDANETEALEFARSTQKLGTRHG